MKQKIKIVDTNFAHAKYSTDYQESKYIEWDRSVVNFNDKLVIYTDQYLQYAIKNKINIAWLMEPEEINSQAYKWIVNHNYIFKFVITHDKKLIDRKENYFFVPPCGCWISPQDQKIYNKNKNVSIIASGKNWTIGHNLRHESIAKFKDKIDVYGRGYNPVEYKLTALKDYMFSLTIENAKKDYWFTEKLIDCFMTGTVPIYWGCPSISKFFNPDGMIIFDNLVELGKILDGISLDKYIKMKSAIEENFEKAKEYLIAEDYIYKNYLKK
jgi:hypothetical protein